MFLGNGNCTSNVSSATQSFVESYTPSGVGAQQIDLTPGVPIPNGDNLCLTAGSSIASVVLQISVQATCYVVPETSVPSETTLRPVSKLTPMVHSSS